MLRSSSLSCCIARRWLCSTGSSLVLRRSVPRQALPFAVSEAEARKSFKEWAADANGPSGSDEIELEAHAVPWWCFDITDPAAWPAERREWVYGGIEHDAVSLESAVSEALKHSGGAQEFEPDHPAWRHIRVEEEALTASIAWETVCAEQEGLDADTSLRAVALVNVPVWKVRYTYLGVGLDAFVCGRTALVDGIHCRGLGAQFFESWLPDEHTFWRKAAPFIKTFDEQAAKDPRAAVAVADMAAKSLGVGAAAFFRVGARVAARHPKVMLASMLLPIAASWAKPVVERGWRAAQVQLRQRQVQQAQQLREQQRDAAGGNEDELDARADWEELLRRGEVNMRAEAPRRSAEEEARRAEAHRRRAIDWDDPRSVLGLPSSGRISPRALEAAFRKELFAWHPDRNPSSQAEAAERTRAILAAYKLMRRQ